MIVTSRRIRVVDYEAAFGVAALMANADDFKADAQKSERAGYTILVSESDPRCYICDLGDRLEMNLPCGESVNIWIGDPEVAGLQAELNKAKLGYDELKQEVENLGKAIESRDEQFAAARASYENQICVLKAKLYDLICM